MTTAVVRPTVRVLLVARAGAEARVLLFRARDSYWFPPGGGLEGDETYVQAAHRELAEETGMTGIALGPHIWNRRDTFEWRGRLLELRERWFLAWLPEPVDIDVTGWTPEEREDITEHRWWSVDELRRATEPLVPRALAELVGGLLRDGVPAEPVEVDT